MAIYYNFFEKEKKKVKFFNSYILRNFTKNKYSKSILSNRINNFCKNDMYKIIYVNTFLYKIELILKTSVFENNHKNANLNCQQKIQKNIENPDMKFLQKRRNPKKQPIKKFTLYDSKKIFNHERKFFMKNNSIFGNFLNSVVFKKFKSIKKSNSLNRKIKVKNKFFDVLLRIAKIFQESFKISLYISGLIYLHFRIKEKIICKYL